MRRTKGAKEDPNSSLPRGSPVLGLDVGDARIGVARGEVGSAFAFGRGVIERSSVNEDVAKIVALARDEGAQLAVLGLPKSRDGSDSPQAKKVRAFAQALQSAGLRLDFQDERFTTHAAARGLRASGLPRMKRREKHRIDAASAVIILETYLARLSHENQEGA